MLLYTAPRLCCRRIIIYSFLLISSIFCRLIGQAAAGTLAAAAAAATTSSSSSSSSSLPHILFVIIDDLGSGDLGMHGSNIKTPTMDALAGASASRSGGRGGDGGGGGIYLDNYYVLPYCSPTRAAILSGRYPLHTGCHSVIKDSDTQGLPLDEETMPQVLQRAGYATHGVGKWHVGHASWEQTPTFRGFSSWFGFYLGWQSYMEHRHLAAYDMHHDSREFCGRDCSRLVDERGNYSTHVFTREAIKIIENYRSSSSNNNENQQGGRPLFLYLAHQAVHEPDEVPEHYAQQYRNNHPDWTPTRQTYAGMLTAADESIANVTRALQERNMWNNTLVILTTDNGGPSQVCGVQGSSNLYPRRGGKCTVYQGGTTGDGIISGPWALANLRLRDTIDDNKNNNKTAHVYPHIFHAVDWLPTLAELANVKPAGQPLDGVSHFKALQQLGNNNHREAGSQIPPPPREEVFVGYAQFLDHESNSSWYGPAIRWHEWKMIQGTSGGPESESRYLPGTISPAPGGEPTSADDYLLYNLNTDPAEQQDVSRDFPVLVQMLQQKLREYQKTYVPPIENDPSCIFPGSFNTTQFGPACLPWCSGSSEIVFYT
jgi:arylsulfatase A-like enzyme